MTALTRTTPEGVQEVGRINSYVVMPVGAHRLIAMVTRVSIAEEAEIRADRTMVTLPSARRLMRATLIGTISGQSFTQGVHLFPVLDNPVLLAAKQDLDVIFGQQQERPDHDDPGYCIEIGESGLFKGRPINVNPDVLFGKHAAVLGSTGSGKSCTIASLIQSILNREEIRRANFVILDTNGEYRSAFQLRDENESRSQIGEWRVLHIPSDSTSQDRLVIPYWFLNTADFARLFGASQGVQRPVLLEALRLGRNESSQQSPATILREELTHEFNRIWSLSGRDERTSKDIWYVARGLLNRVRQEDFREAWIQIADQYGLEKAAVEQAIAGVEKEAESLTLTNQGYPTIIPPDARGRIRNVIEPAFCRLTGSSLGDSVAAAGVSADAPRFFDKMRFRSRHIEQVLRREESGGPRARDYSGTMLLRIDRLLADTRYEFLMGPVNAQMPDATHSLATFLRDVTGLQSVKHSYPPLSDEDAVNEGVLPFYDRQRTGADSHHVVIIDLSLLASEVLENVTALIGRLILEFLQRLGEHGGEQARGSLPVVLVLEEAQNYIHERRHNDDESISREVFERIAREGRKYGLGLVVSSQRPSELSRTVLSQCSSFIVHRLQNPEDLRYFKDIVPGIYGGLLDQLPSLAPQTALVLGECVRAPALLRIRDAHPLPRSRDPKFYKYWTLDESPDIPVEEICRRWEGRELDPAAENAEDCLA